MIFCDGCNASGAYYECSGCNKDYCYDCAPTNLIFYPEEVSGSDTSPSSGLRYCSECEAKYQQEKPSPLLQACKEVLRLRNDQRGYWEDFKVRKDAAEARVKKELGKCK